MGAAFRRAIFGGGRGGMDMEEAFRDLAEAFHHLYKSPFLWIPESDSRNCDARLYLNLRQTVVIIGSSNVGKSCILSRYCHNSFNEEYVSTIGVDFGVKTVALDAHPEEGLFKLQIWDTSGAPAFLTLSMSYLRGMSLCALVYAVDCRQSYEDVTSIWLQRAREKASPSAIILLAGNKCDADQSRREVTTQEAREFALQESLLFIECSAKEGIGLDSLFQLLLQNAFGTRP